jgi:Domain of unknown function (DUF5916)
MERGLRSSLACVLFFLRFAVAGAAAETQLLPPLSPLRTDTPPKIDGVLDDPVWAQAPSETGFKTWLPDFGKDMHEKTVVYYAYDRENLYFAYRCYDSEPSKIKASMRARDTINQDDWICLNIDTFNDHQSIYAFYVNPLGIQGDSRFEGGQEDFTADFVWYSVGRIDAEGYSIEVRIPFKSIRYRSHEPVEMGIIFERHISRFSERGTYPALDPARGLDFLNVTRPLLFAGIEHYTLLELLPAITYGQTSQIEEGALEPQKARGELSLTGKYGLTSQLILDGTVNPDFSQVESDAGQVDFNLRYALYYPEKRPFFLEGQEKFNLAAAELGNPLESAVYTRTIVNPLLGFKLSGKVGPRDTIASLYATDELPSDSPEDYAHVTVVRYKHALSEDSFIGGLWTSRFEGPRYNVVAGSDANIRVSPSSVFGYQALFSLTKPPGQDSEVEGQALDFMYYYQTRDRLFEVTLQDLGKDFWTDTGYLTRNGLTRLKAGFVPMIYPKSQTFLRIDPMFHSINIRDKFSGLYETYDAFDLRAILPRSTTLTAGGHYQTEIYLGQRFGRSGFRLAGTSQITKQFLFKTIYVYGQKIRYVESPYQGCGSDALFSATYLPSEKLNFGLDLTYSDFFRSADGAKEYDYTIIRSANTYQANKYLFFRVILEYNSFYKNLMTDLLASFTYIPGTVVHIGYGSLYEKIAWMEEQYEPSDRFLETKRDFFFKVSYLWRL